MDSFVRSFVDGIRNTVEKYNMLMHDDKVLIALSGGADSVCLLLMLKNHFQKDYNLTLNAIHVNHMLRGNESMRDELFCRDLCRKFDIPLFVSTFDVAEFASESKLSVEEAARNIRYQEFAKYSVGSKTATAHTASDNAETVIINMLRGSGIKGLIGIPAVRDNIIRPLIDVQRPQIEQYLAYCHQDFITDSTNNSLDYTRNKIRHLIIPALADINPSFLDTVASNSYALKLDSDYLEAQAESVFSQCFSPPDSILNLADFPKAIRHRCIIMLLKRMNIPYSSKLVNSADDALLSNGKINVTANIYIIAKNGNISVKHIFDSKADTINKELLIGDNSFAENKICRAEIIRDIAPYTICSKNVHKKLNIYFCDYDKINGKLVLRNRRSGDKIKLQGNAFTSKVKKLLNASIPLTQRDKLCFITDDLGPVIIESIGIADRVKIDQNSKNILKITVIPCEEVSQNF